MSTRKHTPGPWNRGYGNFIYQGAKHAPEGGQRLIATCEPSTRTAGDWDQVFGNAALIAAAPELLDALECFLGEYHADQDKPECKELFEGARAIVAKAKGEAA
jgi:hypothetical protein